MKVLLILAISFAVASAGTRTAKAGEEREALALWKKYCSGGKEGGVDGSTFIHCKHHLGQVTRTVNGGSVDAEVQDVEQRTQYIFVQPAPLHFNHNLQVKTGGGSEPKTVIYVRPAETSHTYDANIEKTRETEHEKPELVFLGGSSSSSSSRNEKPPKETPKIEDAKITEFDKVIQSLLKDMAVAKA